MLVAICDDNLDCIKELENHVRAYLKDFECREALASIDILTFQSGADLLKSFAEQKYDIVFLDIDMPEMNGMETAARIRQIDKKVQIIFVTYLDEQLPYGYRFKASGFVVKPYTSERIKSVLDDAMAWIKAGKREPVEIKTKGGRIAMLDTQEIIYIESFSHYMEAVSKDGRRIKFAGKISELENALSEHNFARLHRSYLVNLGFVFIRSFDFVRLNCGQKLPIGRSYAKKFIDLYEKYRKENI